MSVDPIVFRGIERNLIVLIGGLAIFFGYRLFRLAVTTEGDFAGKGYGVSVSMKRIGPGVFFAFFGATILVVSIVSALREPVGFPTAQAKGTPDTIASGAQPTFSYYGPMVGTVDVSRAQDASNQIKILATLPPRTDITDPAKREQSDHAINTLSNFLPDILQCSFGAANVTAYAKVKDAADRDPANYANNFSKAELDAYTQIKNFKAE